MILKLYSLLCHNLLIPWAEGREEGGGRFTQPSIFLCQWPKVIGKKVFGSVAFSSEKTKYIKRLTFSSSLVYVENDYFHKLLQMLISDF